MSTTTDETKGPAGPVVDEALLATIRERLDADKAEAESCGYKQFETEGVVARGYRLRGDPNGKVYLSLSEVHADAEAKRKEEEEADYEACLARLAKEKGQVFADMQRALDFQRTKTDADISREIAACDAGLENRCDAADRLETKSATKVDEATDFLKRAKEEGRKGNFTPAKDLKLKGDEAQAHADALLDEAKTLRAALDAKRGALKEKKDRLLAIESLTQACRDEGERIRGLRDQATEDADFTVAERHDELAEEYDAQVLAVEDLAITRYLAADRTKRAAAEAQRALQEQLTQAVTKASAQRKLNESMVKELKQLKDAIETKDREIKALKAKK